VQVRGRLSVKVAITDLDFRLTGQELEDLTKPLIERALESCRRALADARVPAQEIREVRMVGGQTRMPAIRRAVRKFFETEPNVSVDPDEVVALGAAVQAAILAGEATGLKLADVTPLSLGVSTKGRMDVLIPRNTPLPTSEVRRVYTTAEDKQEAVEVQIVQGEKPLVQDNVSLAVLKLRGIEPAAAGKPEIEVVFRVDQDGILHVSAKNRLTGSLAEMTITDSLRLSQEEIDRNIREAEELAAAGQSAVEAAASPAKQASAEKEGE
jgi:molecular chaperone DnaK